MTLAKWEMAKWDSPLFNIHIDVYEKILDDNDNLIIENIHRFLWETRRIFF